MLLRTTRPRRFNARIAVALTLAALVTAACDGVHPTGAGSPVSLIILPTGTVPANGTQQFRVVALNSRGDTLTVTPTWNVVAGGGTISSTGLFTAGSTAGVFTNSVQATLGSLTATSNVTVGAPAVASITVTPNPDTLNIGATRQFVAVARDASNNIVTITPVWSVTNGGGTISANGVFTAGSTTGPFANTIRATSGTTFGQSTVVVRVAPVP